MDEADFFRKVLDGADCGMLLDVNNVYVNSLNHGFDAKDFIRRLPLERVGQIHMAGHADRGDVVIDTHEGPIIDPVWKLYEFALKEIGRPVSTLIEWDTNVPPLAGVVEEARRAEGIMKMFGLPAMPPRREPIRSAEELDEAFDPAPKAMAERREAMAAS
jgi:uncharacterized protein (UPF0276 family)